MNFLNIFGSSTPAQQAPAPAAQPVQPGNIPAPTMVAASSNGTAPNGVVPTIAAAPVVPETPLADYATLWETPTVTGQDPTLVAPPELTHELLNKAMQSVDFSSSITPEMSQAIMQGGEGAATAFAQAMGAVAKRVMVESTLVSNRLTKQAVDHAVRTSSAAIPSTLRAQTVTNHLLETNPLFSNPAIKPVVAATQQQLLQKYPNATNAEIATMLNDYLMAMGSAFSPKPAAVANVDEPDWTKFMSM